jgi:hypothetical protein
MQLNFALCVNFEHGWLNCILLILVTTSLTEGSRHYLLCLELLALRISQWWFADQRRMHSYT